jgi:hypothetical protein
MKKLFTLLVLVLTLTTFAQAPQGFNYQATVRNSAGALIVNQNVNFKFNFMLNSQTSVPVFTETHYVPTDDLGQVNLVIGQGTATVGSFSTINWGTGNYYLGIELNTGSGYVAMGTTQLLSVPYALYANSSGNAQAAIPNLASVLAVNNSANNTKIINLADPINAQDAVTKSYLDAQLAILQNQINALNIGSIGTLNCQDAVNNGNLLEANAASNVSIVIPYSSGNGGAHNGQTIQSTGVSGLTATLNSGNFNIGTGTLTYTITGTPLTSGNASFVINIGGQTCIVTRSVTLTVFPKLAVPGNHQGWNPPTAPRIASSALGATDYEGYIYLNGGHKFIAPDTSGNFSWGNTDWGDNGSFAGILSNSANEVDCTATPGYYKIQANTTTLTYNEILTTWSIIGTATSGGWNVDTPMTFNPSTQKWTVTVTLLGNMGEMKFRANNSWDINYGDTGADGSLDEGGANIIPPAGTHTITLDLSNPRAYTYTIQ